MRRIDLNADLGEGCGDDGAIMKIVSRCNIACGGHAGDANSMRAALHLAKENNVAAGAHPSFPDTENFGRKFMDLTSDALKDALSEQVRHLEKIAQESGVELQHLKPHGALYNHAARDLESATTIAEVTASLLPGCPLLGPPGSKLEDAASQAGVRFIGEAFADRTYENDGSLRSRALPGAVITNNDDCAAQAIQIATMRSVASYEGEQIVMNAQSICVHSDTPGAVKSAKLIRDMLEAEGVEVSANV